MLHSSTVGEQSSLVKRESERDSPLSRTCRETLIFGPASLTIVDGELSWTKNRNDLVYRRYRRRSSRLSDLLCSAPPARVRSSQSSYYIP